MDCKNKLGFNEDFYFDEARCKKIEKLKKQIAKKERKLTELEWMDDEYDLLGMNYAYEDEEDTDDYLPPMFGSFSAETEVPEPVEEAYTDRGARRVTRLTETVLSQEKIIVVRGDIYRYQPSQGRYKYLSDIEFCNLVESCLSKTDRDQLTMKPLAEIKEKIKRQPELQRNLDDFNSDPQRINCLNGGIEVDTFNPYEPPEIRLLPHTSDNLFNYCVKARYIMPDEYGVRDRAEAFERFCETSFAGDVKAKRRLLLEQLGYALSDSMRGKCMLLGIGAPNSGKSVIAKFVEELLEPENLCAIAPHELANDFAKARLLVPKINLLAEISSRKLKGIDVIKSITSGDTITAARKGKDSFEFRVKCKLWFFANNFPVPADIDPTDGFFNRLNILFFPNSIPKEKQDLHLLEKLVEEKDLIFSEAVDAFADLVKNGYKFTRPEDSKIFLESYKVQMNSVRTFIEDCLRIGPEERAHTVKLLQLYHNYCIKNGLEELSSRDVHMQLQAIPGVKLSRFTEDGENLRGYHGIGIRTDEDTLTRDVK